VKATHAVCYNAVTLKRFAVFRDALETPKKHCDRKLMALQESGSSLVPWRMTDVLRLKYHSTHHDSFRRRISQPMNCAARMPTTKRETLQKQVSLDAPPRLNVCLRRYSIHTFVHIRPWPLTCGFENLLGNSHSHDEYLWQVSLKSLDYVQRYRVTRNKC